MDGNPYSRMVAQLRRSQNSDSTVRLRLGTVVSRNPFAVSVGGVTLPANCLYRAAGLVPEAGESVLMLTEDDQTFYVLTKVVRAV